MYLCAGFWIFDVLPSPNFHNQEVGLFVLISVNVTDKGAFPDVGNAVKEATGTGVIGTFDEALIVTVFVALVLPAVFFTVKLTVYFPALVNICEILGVVAVVPSPKFQFTVAELAVVLVNVTSLVSSAVVADGVNVAAIGVEPFTVIVFITV